MIKLINIVIIAASLSSFLLGFLISNLIIKTYTFKQTQKNVKNSSGINFNNLNNNFCSDGLYNKILIYMYKLSYKINVLGNTTYISSKFKISKNFKNKKIIKLIKKSNFTTNFDNRTYRESQFKFCIFISVPLILIASLFSYTLMSIFAIIGLLIGINLPIKALKEEMKSRTFNLEKQLPEMLEVVALGLRSGLTFDRSIKIYTIHFDNEFSRSFRTAQQKWENGLSSIDKSLRDLSDTYDSNLFNRVIDNIIRSLRFGTPFVNNLEEAAIEARESYKNKQKELISKAPVKMMIPTGTLILPAMLMLVLGPVLLELINGF